MNEKQPWSLSDGEMEIYEAVKWHDQAGAAWRDPRVNSIPWASIRDADKSAIESAVKQGTVLPSSDGYAARLPDGTVLAVSDIITYKGIEKDGATSAIVVRADSGACTVILMRHDMTFMRVVYERQGKQIVTRIKRYWEDGPKIEPHPDALICKQTQVRKGLLRAMAENHEENNAQS